MVPSVTPPIPMSIPPVAASSPLAASTHPGRRPKTTARKNVLAFPCPEGSPLIGASSKGVTFPDLNVQQNLPSAVPFTSPEGPAKQKPSSTPSPPQSVSTEVKTNPSAQDSESSLSPHVLTLKAKGKRKSKVASPKLTKKAKVAQAKGTSSISDSTPLSKFKMKAKINPPTCTSSEDVSPETEDSLPKLDQSLTELIHEEPQEDPLLEDSEEETKSEEDSSETTHVASDPKGKKPLAFPELSTKSTKPKGAPIHSSGSSFKAHYLTFCVLMVYVSGHWYKFSPAEIEIDDSIEFAKDQVLSELVGQSMVWEPSASLRVSDLTHYYCALFKFSMFNWLPTTHFSNITQDMAFLLFKIGIGITVDLPFAIFDQIVSLSGEKCKGQHLMFPQVIYKLLDSQQPLTKSYETLIPPLIGPTYTVKEVKDDNAPTTVRKVKGINLAGSGSGDVEPDSPALQTTLTSI
ncbi:uncharacterized protein LOC133785435 [Humulus lupulus]|uniref:uncharacterized protein LOC133785435 n=1 Tax=Humulus lupulus TaxID=3486 RepID=UPI002B4093A2|nr:uncharacterized protein LOC133785435 [Humulus lupulus]